LAFSSHAVILLIASVMPLRWPKPWLCASRNTNTRTDLHVPPWLYFILITSLVALSDAMTPGRIAQLRQETVDMFYHGFDNYMDIAFPEDEVCCPFSFELNAVI